MLNIIKDLYKMNRCLLGEGYDNAIEYLKHLLDLEVLEFPSGTEIGTWTVPDEWVIKDAWVKFKGKKILDYKKNPLCLAVNSKPVKRTISSKEFKRHLYFCETLDTATPYEYKYYQKEWGFCMPRNKIAIPENELCPDNSCVPDLKDLDPEVGKAIIEGQKIKEKTILQRGKYDVFIDSEFRKGIMKVAVHTIKGKTDREILLIAHLDHPYQANDNLSSVAMLVDLAHKIKKEKKLDHTIKIIFCPETIGSIAYALTQDISKVDFMISPDMIGNDGMLLMQKSFEVDDKLNHAGIQALKELGEDYKLGNFRHIMGADEYVFGDPKLGIPGIFITRHPYKEYHSDADTPKIIDKKKILEVQKVILEIIRLMESDRIPERTEKFTGPLMRSKYDVQVPNKQYNREMDYFIYAIDGKRSLLEIVSHTGLAFTYCDDLLKKLEKDGYIRSHPCKERQQETDVEE